MGKYTEIPQQLLTQGMCQLLEPALLIRCRQVDQGLVESIIPAATAEYKAKLLKTPPDILTLYSGKHQEINKSSYSGQTISHGDDILSAADRRLPKLEKRTPKKSGHQIWNCRTLQGSSSATRL